MTNSQGLSENFCGAVRTRAENFPFLQDQLVKAGFYKRLDSDASAFPAKNLLIWEFEGKTFLILPHATATELLEQTSAQTAQLRNGPFVYGMSANWEKLKAGKIVAELFEGEQRTGIIVEEEAAFRLNFTGSLEPKKTALPEYTSDLPVRQPAQG